MGRPAKEIGRAALESVIREGIEQGLAEFGGKENFKKGAWEKRVDVLTKAASAAVFAKLGI